MPDPVVPDLKPEEAEAQPILHPPEKPTLPCPDPVPVPEMVRTRATAGDIAWAMARRAFRTLVYGGAGVVLLRELARFLPAQYGPILEIAGALLGVGVDKGAREAARSATGEDIDWPVYVAKKVKEATTKGGAGMKPINWLVIVDLAFTIVVSIIPDFPKEAAVLAITNAVTVILYVIHKAKGSTPQ